MIYYHDVEQGTDEWLALRCGRLTCSQMAVAIGNGETRARLVREKAGEVIVGKPEIVRYQSPAMAEGTRREEEARWAYVHHSKVAVDTVGFVTNDEHPHLGYSPDGLLTEAAGSGSGGIIEIKNPIMSTHIGYLRAGGLPSAYRHQVIGGMLIADAAFCDFISYYPGLPLFVHRQHRDSKEEIELLEKIEKFLTDVHDLVAWIRGYGLIDKQ